MTSSRIALLSLHQSPFRSSSLNIRFVAITDPTSDFLSRSNREPGASSEPQASVSTSTVDNAANTYDRRLDLLFTSAPLEFPTRVPERPTA